VDALVPSLVFAARDARGSDIFDVGVVLDGKRLVERLDGRPVEVDPGQHVVRFEAKDYEAVEQRVLVREGEKARTGGGTMHPLAPRVLDRPVEAARPIPMATWILGGVGAFAFATAGGATLIALPTWSRCHKGGCPPSEQTLSNSLNTVGDIGLAV